MIKQVPLQGFKQYLLIKQGGQGMTKDDIYNILDSLIVMDDVGYIIMTTDTNFISVDDFYERFKETELSLSGLRKNKNAAEGWLGRFLDWNERGILPD